MTLEQLANRLVLNHRIGSDALIQRKGNRLIITAPDRNVHELVEILANQWGTFRVVSMGNLTEITN